MNADTQILNHNVNSSLELVAMIIRVMHLNMQTCKPSPTKNVRGILSADEAIHYSFTC